jgi:uncharacterized protein YndB with AHSA1/START domain
MTERVEPIQRSVHVRCGPERAFHVFTALMGRWWPVDTHSRSAVEFEGQGVKVDRIEFQGGVGGLVIEHMSDGNVLPWAEVLAWDPPRSFVLAWRPHPRPQPPTEVEVTFTPQAGGTLVELEHRGWERLTEDFRDLYASYAEGWIQTLRWFAAEADDDVT